MRTQTSCFRGFPAVSGLLFGLLLALIPEAAGAQLPGGVVTVEVGGGDAPVATQQPTTPIAVSPRNGRRLDEQAHPLGLVWRAAIERALLRSPGDLLTVFDALPGLRVQTTSSVLGTSVVRIQGLPGRYSRLLLDGVHLFGDRPGSYTPLRIPLMDLDRIEVIKGPASSFYGSDSAAGAINLISRQPGAEPAREILFNQSSRNATDGVLWLSTPATGPARRWSQTWLVSGHRQEEADVDDDGWSDLPDYSRGVIRQRTFWNNGKGRSVAGVAGVTFEKRKGGSAFAREQLETKTADGGLSGEMQLESGMILAGAGALFVQSRTRDFSDGRERDRLQTATIELTLRRPSARHSWLAGVASDWYAIRSSDALPTKYVSTRPGIFFHDDWQAASWLLISGSARVDYHNLYDLLISPRGSVLMRNGQWSARVSAAQGYYTPRPLMEETEAAGFSRLTIEGPLEKETARSVSGDITHTTGATVFSVTVFRTQIDDPALIDRTTYTLRTEDDPIRTRGVELLGTVRRGSGSLTGTYTLADTRERGGRQLALTPKHSGSILAAVDTGRTRAGLDVSFTGEQRLDANPYRTTSEAFTVVNLFGEQRFGRFRLFINLDNVTDVRQTDWDPMARPARDIDGRWTVDAWAPVKGRVINGGLRIVF